MSAIEDFRHRLPNDGCGLPSAPFERVEHGLRPWEERCHALADVLDFHKIINTKEKRRGVEELGAEMIARLGYNDPNWLVSRHEAAAGRASAVHAVGEALAATGREATGNVEEGS